MPARYIPRPPRDLKHLPVKDWPEADRLAFDRAYVSGDIFDEDAGPGSHLAGGSRRMIQTAYRRWLGFIARHHPNELGMSPNDRLNPVLVRSFVENLQSEVRSTTVAQTIRSLYAAAQIIAPGEDWGWLGALGARLQDRSQPLDRFERLVPPWETLDLGIELMDQAKKRIATLLGALQFRDGLIVALISAYPMRRRTFSAPTVATFEIDQAGISILLDPADTKSKRHESARLTDELVPYVRFYLAEVRPRFIRRGDHGGFWVSAKLGRLDPGRIYDIVRARVFKKFGKLMSLHDFRRAAATFVATHAPEKIGIIPGVLHHSSPEVSERWYILARSVEAGRRHAAALAGMRARLRASNLPDGS